ncbi:MAG: hypothetical protein ACK5AL_03320 [Planctomycetota bacterium]
MSTTTATLPLADAGRLLGVPGLAAAADRASPRQLDAVANALQAAGVRVTRAGRKLHVLRADVDRLAVDAPTCEALLVAVAVAVERTCHFAAGAGAGTVAVE